MSMRVIKQFSILAILSGTIILPFAAYADGLTATGNVLPIGANGTTVLTITGGSTPSAAFSAPVSVNGTLSSTGILSATAGINVNNNGIFYPDGSAFLASNATIGGNVGIGTTTPQASLDIYQVKNNTPIIRISGDNTFGSPNQIQIQGRSDSNQQLYIGYNTSGNYASIQASYGPGESISAKPLALNPFGGGVGIGITNPVEALDIGPLPDAPYTFTGITVHGNQSPLANPGVIFQLSSDGFDMGGGIGAAQSAGAFSNDAQPGDLVLRASAGHDLRIANIISVTGNPLSPLNTTQLIVKNNGNVGIGTSAPGGTLDIENASNNATLCLNGQCVNKLSITGATGAQGPQGPQGPAGPAGPQGPAGSTAVLNISCGPNQVLTGISNGNPVCQDTVQLQTFLRVSTTTGNVNNNCGYPADPNPPNYNQLQYNTTCASRFCASVYGYGWGMLTEDGPGYNMNQPWNSDPNTYVSIACSK